MPLRPFRPCPAAILTAAFVAAAAGNAAATTGPETDPWRVCLEAIAAAERKVGLPPHLLHAVATVESGRRDESDNRWKPWPWTINNAGDSYFHDAKAEAIATVETLKGVGETNIDVGCMQVNLRYHPNAFASLDEAFDPAANVGYAARLIKTLYGQYKSWIYAVALYHSPKYMHSFKYRQRVMKTWNALRGSN